MTLRYSPHEVDERSMATELRESIDRFSSLVRRRWRTFVVVFAVAAFTIQAIGFIWPSTYEAHAAILLQKTRLTGGVDADRTAPTTVVSDTVSQEEVNSEIAILTSRQVVETTAKATGLDQITPPWYSRVLFAPLRGYEWAYSWLHGTPYPTPSQRALAGLMDSLSIQRLKDSNILVASYRAGDPRFAEAVLDELLKHYLDWHVSVHRRNDVQPFFNTQAEVVNKEIAALQAQLQELKASVGVADFTVERENAIRREAELSEERLRLQRQVVELDGRILASRQLLEGDEWTRVSTTTRPASQALDSMRAEVLRLELEQIRLESRFAAGSPFVVENRAKLDAARRALEEQRRSVGEESTLGIDPARTALRQDLSRLTAERAGIARRLATVSAQQAAARERLTLLDAKAVDAEQLNLQLQSARERYVMYLDRTEKARVDAALDGSRVANVSIVQHANASLKPVKPRRLITFLVAIFGGAAIALAVTAWLELMAAGLSRTLEAAAPRAESTV